MIISKILLEEATEKQITIDLNNEIPVGWYVDTIESTTPKNIIKINIRKNKN